MKQKTYFINFIMKLPVDLFQRHEGEIRACKMWRTRNSKTYPIPMKSEDGN